MQLRPVQRLMRIAQIIEAVDKRLTDDHITHTLEEMKPEEIREIYKLAKGGRLVLNPNKKSSVKYI